MQNSIINFLILLLTVFCIGLMLKKNKLQPTESIPLSVQLSLAFSSIIAFFMDTLGVGSFACNIALAKYFDTFKDEELPGMVNGAQVLPGALSAFFFLGLVQVDTFTLITLIAATCIGGVVGASIISKFNAQTLRLVMLVAFPTIALLILGNQLGWLPLHGEKIALRGVELLLGCVGLFIAGSLTAAGVGLFAMVQAILFCLGMSPIVAFPIMTAAGALQQPLSTSILMMKNNVPLKKSLLMNVYGVFGVLIALPIITHLSSSKLHVLLVIVLGYNTFMMGKNYLKNRKILGIAEKSLA
jgi:uncharacterized membrane protein YfcA